ncbi:peptidylprolyl isomerase [Parahaliea mediterranea]|uniref:peptidylprolyl isomerase n=1 Tax=Parahaliea mediterranea TaxID=651086 RepID=UPI000E2E6C72|nr:peptidylprolyl isomerase [Parahaliea mediterranea]
MQLIDLENLPEPPPVTIRVGATEIDESHIAQEMQHHPASSQQEAFAQAARALVVRELLLQRAAELGLRSGTDAADDEAGIAALLERELSVPEPDEAACRRFFQANPERFSEPARLKVSHILLPAAPEDARARDTQYRQGKKLLAELAAHPERFAEFAMRHSACPSKDSGGNLGWLSAGQTVPELDRALKHLSQGLHVEPLASRYGWHVVSVDERIEAQAVPFEAVSHRVRHSLQEQASRRALRHYLLALAEQIGVEGLALDEDAGALLMQ